MSACSVVLFWWLLIIYWKGLLCFVPYSNEYFPSWLSGCWTHGWSDEMGPICWLKSSCSSSCCYPVISLFSFPPWVHSCKRVVISSPCFFPLSTIPIVHLYTSLSRSSYPFPHSSLQESSILHHTHFPLIHSPSHSLVYMDSHGCMPSFTPSHTH